MEIRGSGTDRNLVAGNRIGTDATGTSVVANTYGVRIYSDAKSNRIGTNGDGTSDAFERNIISGSTQFGVQIEGVGTSSNTVAGNFIGTDLTGAVALSNAIGVSIEGGASSNIIGGSASTARNVISGNSNYGLQITGTGTSSNVVAGNYVGNELQWTFAGP